MADVTPITSPTHLPRRSWREQLRRISLSKRIMVGVPAGIIVGVTCLLAPWAFHAIIIAAAALASQEVAGAVVKLSDDPSSTDIKRRESIELAAGLLGGLMVVAGIVAPSFYGVVAAPGIVLIPLLFFRPNALSARFPKHTYAYHHHAVFNIAASVWYAGVPMGFISVLHRQPHGDRLTFGVLLLVVVADVMALATGISLGQILPYKPAKVISPNKTLIGMIGGFTSPLLVGGLLDGTFLPAHTGWYLGGLIGIFAQVGDILASALKRSVGIKDYASRLPGHGGLMDRADSAGPGALTAWCYLAPWLHLIPLSVLVTSWR